MNARGGGKARGGDGWRPAARSSLFLRGQRGERNDLLEQSLPRIPYAAQDSRSRKHWTCPRHSNLQQPSPPAPPTAPGLMEGSESPVRLSHTIRQHSLGAPAAGHGADGGPVLTVRRPANRETGALKRGVSGAAGNPEESVANPLWRKRGGLS